MNAMQIIEQVMDMPLVGETARKADYVIEQALYGNRTAAEVDHLAGTLARACRIRTFDPIPD